MYTATMAIGRVTRKSYSVSRQTGTPLLRLTLSEIGSGIEKQSEPIEVELWGKVAQTLESKIAQDSIVVAIGQIRLLFTKSGEAFLGLKGDRCHPLPLVMAEMLNLGTA